MANVNTRISLACYIYFQSLDIYNKEVDFGTNSLRKRPFLEVDQFWMIDS
jgi:hypothetical protein